METGSSWRCRDGLGQGKPFIFKSHPLLTIYLRRTHPWTRTKAHTHTYTQRHTQACTQTHGHTNSFLLTMDQLFIWKQLLKYPVWFSQKRHLTKYETGWDSYGGAQLDAATHTHIHAYGGTYGIGIHAHAFTDTRIVISTLSHFLHSFHSLRCFRRIHTQTHAQTDTLTCTQIETHKCTLT